MRKLDRLALAGVVSLIGISVATAAVPATEVVNLPTAAALGGGDQVGSQLVAATYNGGKGPGIWIVADGGYRLYHNGALLAEDNQAGRVRFVPMTFLPGENAISVLGVNGQGAPGVMVQIDELDRSYYSGSGWYAKPDYGIYNNAWKNKGRDLSQWGGATSLSYSNTSLPSGGTLSGWPSGSQSKWIWTGKDTDTTVALLFNLNIKAEGFGAKTTGGSNGKIVVASTPADIQKHLQSKEAVTILVPEGTYDFRKFRDAATDASNAGRTWCVRQCSSNDKNSRNLFYRIAFEANCCRSLNDGAVSIVKKGAVQKWDNWITIKNNKSLLGMGRGANLRGAALANRTNEGAGNNIFRNLAIYDVNPHLIEANDGLSVSGGNGKYVYNIWADHISYKWISDGMDLEFLKGGTVSYLDYDGANEYNCYYYDPYMHLVENGEVTMANVYWHNTFGRIPKLYNKEGDPSKLHIYNAYLDYNHWHVIDVNGNGYGNAELLYENSYIKDARSQIAGKNDSQALIKMSNVKVANAKSSTPYVNQGVSQSAMFNDNVFSPGYSYQKRDVNNLPSEMPALTGVGGRYGKMPSYNQAFGQSKKAASVSMTAPAANATFQVGDAVTLSASATANGSSVKSVAFYVGNTLVGTATSSPYQVSATGIEAGVHSAVAVVTDNAGLSQMSAFVTFTVEGETYPEVVKCGAGSSNQSINLGEAIADFCYTWTGAETVVPEGFPAGIVTNIDKANRKISISGTPSEAGVFSFSVSATNNDSTFVKNGRITVTDPNAPASSSSVPVESSAEVASSESVVPESSSSEETLGIAQSVNMATEAETGFYRIFDLQGRPLYAGFQKPATLPAARAVVVEYTKSGAVKRRYLEKR